MNEEIFKKLGIKLGHYTDKENLTGMSVIIAEKGANIGIDTRGSNTATLNIPSYDPKATGKLAHGVVLTGGSTYGLESAFGVMQFLEEQNIGNQTRAGVIPGVTGAVIFDVAVGNGKVRPNKENGYYAAKQASFSCLAEGNVGVGTGATTGKWMKGKPLKGGFGIGITTLQNDIIVSAFVVTNAVGDIVNPRTGKFYADEGNYILPEIDITKGKLAGLMDLTPKNTTLAVIATNVSLEKNQLMKISELAHDGYARSIFPVHTMMDGDVIFALSSLSGERKTFSDISDITLTDVIGLAAQDAITKAIKSSMLHTESINGFPAYSKSTS